MVSLNFHQHNPSYCTVAWGWLSL